MRHETILKRLEEVLREGSGKRAKEKLIRLVEELSAYLQRQEEKKQKYGKAIQHLMGWYVNLWKGNPPEKIGRANWQDMVGKTLRELVMIYEQNNLTVDDIKKDYEDFLKLKEGWLKGDGSISRFKAVLSNLKQTDSRWVSPENARGIDKYLFSEEDGEELPF